MFESPWMYASSLILVLAAFLLVYYHLAFQYFKKRRIPEAGNPGIPFGNILPPFWRKKSMNIHLQELYTFGKSKNFKFLGMYEITRPKIISIDLEITKNILQRNFDHFTERGFYYNEKDDPLSANLFAIGGTKWKILRGKLSPAYTSGKLKIIFDGMLQCATQMEKSIVSQTINIKDISECYTIDVIGCCAFGLECNSFKNPNSEFRACGKKIFHFDVLRTLKTMFAFGFPDLARTLGVTLFAGSITDFLTNVVRETVTHRQTNNVRRKDFLQLLLDLKDSDVNFTLEELTAQVFIFFAAGFETSSITLAFLLYEITYNQDIQEKLREEIKETLAGCEISYDTVMEMKYLNQVVEETLRKYPPVSFITRIAVKDYHVPDSDVIIEKHVETVISILGIHRDPEYYPNPEEFDPERFSEENKQRRVPLTYMPFGEGPRICIGMRFGLLQVKVGLVSLLKHFKFTLNSKTKVPLEIQPYSFTLTPKDGIYLDVQRIED